MTDPTQRLRDDIVATLRAAKPSPIPIVIPYRKEKETNELIFSWLSWLAVLLVGAYGR